MTKKAPSTTRTKGSSRNRNVTKSEPIRERTATGRRTNIDWEPIEREYRAGLKTDAAICREFDVDPGQLSRKAKRLGWKRDLRSAIRKAAEKANLQANVEKSADTSQAVVKPATSLELDAETVEKYSGLVASILGKHQDIAKRLRNASEQLVGEIEAALHAIEPAIQQQIKLREKAIRAQRARKREQGEAFSEVLLSPLTGRELLTMRLQLLRQIVDLKCKTVQPLDRLIQIERQSYGLQDGDGHAVDDINYDTLLRELHGV